MTDSLLIAVLAGLGGMVGWGAADFFAKKTVDRVGAVQGLVWGHAFGSAIFILIALTQMLLPDRGFSLPGGLPDWAGLAGFGVLQMIVYWLLYQGFEKGLLAVLNPIFASYGGLVALVSILFLGEPVTTVLLIALAAIFIGILLVNTDLESLKSRRINVVPGLKEVALATLLAAVWTLGWDRFISGQDSLTYSLLMYLFMTLAAVGLAVLTKVSLRGVPVGVWKYLVLIGGGEALAYLAISWGFSATSLTGVVALISGAFSVPTVILAYLFLHERISRLQALAIVIIIAGIAGVTIG